MSSRRRRRNAQQLKVLRKAEKQAIKLLQTLNQPETQPEPKKGPSPS